METLVMEERERDGLTAEADRAVLEVAMKVNAVMEVGVMLSTDGSVSPCEGQPERASKAGCGAVIGAAPRLGWTDVGRIGHGLDRGATTSASELSAMTLVNLRMCLERPPDNVVVISTSVPCSSLAMRRRGVPPCTLGGVQPSWLQPQTDRVRSCYRHGGPEARHLLPAER